MPAAADPNLGIVSLTYLQLIDGPGELSATRLDELAQTLGSIAGAARTGQPDADLQDSFEDAIACGLVTDRNGRRVLTNRHIGELAEAWWVADYLQPEYVDMGQMYDSAIRRLALIGRGAVPFLVELLGHSETSVAKGAAVALGDIGAAALPAVQWAIRYGNARVRKYGLDALSGAARAASLPEAVLELVVTVLCDDSNPLVRIAAASVLSGVDHPVAVEGLRRVLDQSLDPLTRSSVMAALERLDSPAARRAIDDARRSGQPSGASGHPEVLGIAAPDARAVPTRTPRVFLSYAREDTLTMEEYRRRLQLTGFDVWADSERLVAGERWSEELKRALEASDFVVALLSESSWDGYQRIEVEEGLAQARSRSYPFLVPLFLSREYWLAGSDDWPDELNDIHVIAADGPSEGWRALHEDLCLATRIAQLKVPVFLRSEPRHDFDESEVWRTVFAKDFFSRERNPNGRPIGTEWDLVWNGAFAQDGTTGLTWTRQPVALCDLKTAFRVPQAFKERFILAGSIPFRLPTVEEAMSLMTPIANDEGCYRTKYMTGSPYMLTSDTMPAAQWVPNVGGVVWVADFHETDVHLVPQEKEWPVWLVASDKFG